MANVATWRRRIHGELKQTTYECPFSGTKLANVSILLGQHPSTRLYLSINQPLPALFVLPISTVFSSVLHLSPISFDFLQPSLFSSGLIRPFPPSSSPASSCFLQPPRVIRPYTSFSELICPSPAYHLPSACHPIETKQIFWTSRGDMAPVPPPPWLRL